MERRRQERYVFSGMEMDSSKRSKHCICIKCYMAVSWFGICLILALTFYHNFWPALLSIPTLPLYERYVKKGNEEKKKRQLRVHFRDSLQILEGWLQAGSSIERGMLKTESELQLLLGKQNEMVLAYHRMNMGISVNRSAEEMWAEFAMESGLYEAETFSHLFGLVRRRGGRLSEVSAHVVKQISTSIMTEEEIQTMLQGKKTEMRIMYVVPIFILLYMSLFGSDMIQVMYETWKGRMIMTACLGVYLGVWLLGEKLLEVKV